MIAKPAMLPLDFAPEIVVKGTPLDIELCALLGETQMDFIVVYSDGVQSNLFGTPYDSQREREVQIAMVNWLNDRSKKGGWPKVFEGRKAEICHQFKLPAETTAKEFHPEFTFKIHRVCTGYSEHTHAAIGLLETIDAKLMGWNVGKVSGGYAVDLWPQTAGLCRKIGDQLPRVIAEAVRRLLLAEKEAA